jgi:RNA recognition motif-containing protein
VNTSTGRRDSAGRPRGFGFVEIATDEEAQAAIQALDGTDLHSRTLRVSVAKPRGGGGGGYGGGDRW